MSKLETDNQTLSTEVPSMEREQKKNIISVARDSEVKKIFSFLRNIEIFE